MVDPEKFAQALFKGSVEEVKKLTQECFDRGEKAQDILNRGLVKAMEQVGVKFKNCEIYIPEVLIAARAMHAGMGMLKPILAKSTASTAAKIVLGTVQGDLHDIGKNLVGMLLEGGGLEVVDIGIDVSPEKFVQAAKDAKAQIVGISTLLTTTMLGMKDVLRALEQADIRSRVKVMVGGAPVTQSFANEIGADGYGESAADAVDKAKTLLGIAPKG